MSSDPPKPGAVPGWGQPSSEPPGPVPSTPVPPAPVSGATPGWGQAPVPPPPVPPAPVSGATPPPGTPPAGGWNPQPAASSGSSGCLKIILILVAVGAILFTLLIVGLIFLGGQIASSVGVNPDGSVGKPCTIVDNGSLSTALGSKAEAIQLEGLYDATIGIILDKRVLPNAEDCWITADQSTAVGRIARYVGGDAASVFQAERKRAAPTFQDQSGGVSIDNSGYFGGDVSGLGDEAFCTGVSTTIQAGVLVRKGDTLVYVSLGGAGNGSPPAFDTTADGVVTAPSICATAQAVARAILH